MRTRTFLALAGLAAVPMMAQLAVPAGNRSVSMGHVHLLVHDVDAQRQFWVAFGGVAKVGAEVRIEFPGVFVMLRQGEPTGGTIGSVVNHIGFNVKSVAESVAKWKAAGLKPEPGARPTQAWFTTADGVRIEILEDDTITVPLKFQHVHYNVPAGAEPQVEAWYAKMFGAVPAMRGRFKGADIAGANLTFQEAEGKAVPTKGRAIDHVGFQVLNLDSFIQKLHEQGVEMEGPVRTAPNGITKVAFLTDPWGTSLELTEGLGK
jgi:catechol 2,3-dioxygenase-like lactoylglutathione lyase family enzyme